MRKKRIQNICMVLMILLAVIGGLLGVGAIKGWFTKSSSLNMTVSEKNGIVMVERSGVSFEIESGAPVYSKDQFYTQNAATLILSEGATNRIYINEDTKLILTEEDEKFYLEVVFGEILVDARGWDEVSICSQESEFSLNQAVVSISAQAGATTAEVFSGEIQALDQKLDKAESVAGGQALTIVRDTKTFEISSLDANSLNEFQIRQLMACNMDKTFCFTEEELVKVQENREAELLLAQQSLLEQEEDTKQDTADQTEEPTSKSTESETEKSSWSHEAEANKSTESSQKIEKDQTEVQNQTTEADKSGEKDKSKEESSIKTDQTSGTGNSTDSDTAEKSEENTAKYCTIEIRCDTILNNMDHLTPGLEGYVPSNGTILAASKVAFTEGETVFDVLKRTCNTLGIQIEYSYTPIYESYYIEGINHLYEFDCGNESGWMYKVNGWFPNYGCSSYTVKEGDVIVWCYTCNGLGADVGGGMR